MNKNFKPIALCAILVVSIGAARSDDRADWSCDPGWVAFKDEKCFKIFDSTTQTYADAVSSCASLASDATLPIIKTREEQTFLANYLFNNTETVDNFWIGGKFQNGAYYWNDNTNFTYTNWDSRSPRNRPNYCVQMQSDVASVGKWLDEPCGRKNGVVCQLMRQWTIDYIQKIILDLRNSFENANIKISQQKQELLQAENRISEQKHEIDILKKNQIPIGFIYTQLPNEKPPASIWPSMTWTDVSSAYAGVFFRVEGGGSEPFGQIQAENDRSVVRMESTRDGWAVHQNKTIDANTVGQNTQTSDWIWTGDDAKEEHNSVLFRLVSPANSDLPARWGISIVRDEKQKL